QDRIELVGDLRVGPVEVGLFWREQMEIPLTRTAVRSDAARPCRAAEHARPVGRRLVTARPLALAVQVSRPRGAARRAREGLLHTRVRVRGVARASWNHGCWSEVWFGTMSRRMRNPCAWTSSMNASASSIFPNAGSIA